MSYLSIHLLSACAVPFKSVGTKGMIMLHSFLAHLTIMLSLHEYFFISFSIVFISHSYRCHVDVSCSRIAFSKVSTLETVFKILRPI